MVYNTRDNLKSVNVFPDSALFALTIDNVFTEKECKEWIELTEKRGYEKALINVGGGMQVMNLNFRNNDRCIIDDEEMADKLYQRIQQFVPERLGGATKVSLNERLRFLRYTPGQEFKQHYDGNYLRESGPKKGEISYITLQLYLNGDCTGGETSFFVNNQVYHVTPKPGMVLLFEHEILHQGSKVTDGVKYVMRTDVMYKPNRV